MHADNSIFNSISRKLVNRLGNPLEWTYVNKVLFLLFFQLIIYGTFVLYNVYIVQFPDSLPGYLSVDAAKKGVPAQVILFSLYVGLALIALLYRMHNRDNHLIAYVFAATIAVHCAVFLAAIGYATNPLTFLCVFLQAFVGLLLFDTVFSTIVLTAWTLTIGICFLSEQLNLIKYAAVIERMPIQDDTIDAAWFTWMMGSGIFLTALGFFLSVYVLNRWRHRERQVVEYSELLKTMFGRYLSTEVMSSLIENPSLLELGGERREVTIMVTDLRGFTAISERLHAEQVVQLLNTYFEIMVETVLKYNGTINEILGDALWVIFGAPHAVADQAENAVACSIDMQNAMAEVNTINLSQNLPTLEMGIGINKAEVVIGNIGSSKRSKYTVIGSGVNMTSRIESYTAGGQILVSESVHKEIGHKLQIVREQEVYPKGSETSIKIYEVGGIADEYHLVLNSQDNELVNLLQSIKFSFSLFGGKHVRKSRATGKIVRLSAKSAEVSLETVPEMLTNIKMNLLDVSDELLSKDVYGKILETPGSGRYVVRFTSVPAEVASFFHAFRLLSEKPVQTGPDLD